MSIEAMRQALEALDEAANVLTSRMFADAAAALREAIEQAEKPVCEVLNERGEVDYISYVPPVGTPLYTTPQSNNDFKPDWDTVKVYDEKFAEILDEIQRLRAELKFGREWVGLTDEEIDSLDLPPSGTATVRDLVRLIEAKLREKNVGLS